jgi:hypothetical protein
MLLRNVGLFSTDYTSYTPEEKLFITTAVRTSNAACVTFVLVLGVERFKRSFGKVTAIVLRDV